MTSLGPQWIARFPPVALVAVSVLIAAGVYMARTYVGSWQGLIGSGYGAMVLTKIAFLGLALALAAWNYAQLRQWRIQRRAKGMLEKLPLFLSAEAWVLGVVMLGAAALTSLPLAVDTAAQRLPLLRSLNILLPRQPLG